MKASPLPTKESTKLYVLHGWTYSLDAWQSAAGLLRKAGVEPVFLRVPGLTRPSRKVWTIDDYVSWLDGQLSKVVRPVVLGHSNGGRILLNYCARHPGKLERLILVNSAGVAPSLLRRWRNTLFRYLSKLFSPLKRLRVARCLVHRLLGAGDYERAPANMKLTLSHMLAADRRLPDKLPAIGTPVDFIWGEKDRVTPLSAGRFLHDRLPAAASFKVLPDAGHAPYLTHPEEVTAAILEILVQ